MAHICTLAGSLRAGSYNRMLAAWIGDRLREGGHEVVDIDMREHNMPLFDEDLESAQGTPASVQQVHECLCQADALVMVTPEYNGSVSAVLKNTIDWVTRPCGEHVALAAISGKPVLLGSASPGGLGGIRALMHLQVVMGGLGMHVFPRFASLPSVQNVFEQNGSAKNEVPLKGVGVTVDGFHASIERFAERV